LESGLIVVQHVNAQKQPAEKEMKKIKTSFEAGDPDTMLCLIYLHLNSPRIAWKSKTNSQSTKAVNPCDA